MRYPAYPKTPRLIDSHCTVTEKIDGTNALIAVYHQDDVIVEHADKIVAQVGEWCLFAGSRKRWIVPGDDNFGFAGWVQENAQDLAELGEGRHYGEWWGAKIQRSYGLDHKRFSLFNIFRWHDVHHTNDPSTFAGESFRNTQEAPAPCHVVPVVAELTAFDTDAIAAMGDLVVNVGSFAAPGFDRPEGLIVHHGASRQPFKHVIDKD